MSGPERGDWELPDLPEEARAAARAAAGDEAEETPGPEVILDGDGLTLPLAGGPGEPGPAEEVDAPPEPVTAGDLAALAEVQAELEARAPETVIEPSLDRIRLLMDLLGHPQRAYPVIHVAGTNGKTSTARMIESLLRAFHRRTGRYTSPHLQLVTERIAVDGAPVHPREFVRAYREIAPYVAMVDERSEIPMSTFEVLTGLAYAVFADAPVDVAVAEVGLGGSWDATNVVDSQVAVIMPVGMDHMDHLGGTLAEIAAEKAGIISPREDSDDPLAPEENIAVVAAQEPEAMEVIMRRAVETGAAVARAGLEFDVTAAGLAVGGQMLTLRGVGGEYPDIHLPLAGEHQARNAAVALAAVETFFGAGGGRQLDLDTVREGFARVASPGRLERVRSAPATFLDAAHNPHGAAALGAALERDFAFDRLIGVLACLADKDVPGILRALEPRLHEVVCTRNASPRCLPAEDLAEEARAIFGEERVHLAGRLDSALELAYELAEDADLQSGSGVVVTGSVITAGEARSLFGKEPR